MQQKNCAVVFLFTREKLGYFYQDVIFHSWQEQNERFAQCYQKGKYSSYYRFTGSNLQVMVRSGTENKAL